MLSDLIACLILYYLFFILQNPTETAIDASQPTEEPLDDWEPELAGEVTLLCSTPSLPPTLRPDGQLWKPVFICLLLLIACIKSQMSTRSILIHLNRTGGIRNKNPFVTHFLPKGENQNLFLSDLLI